MEKKVGENIRQGIPESALIAGFCARESQESFFETCGRSILRQV
jgi:hypothetical protein